MAEAGPLDEFASAREDLLRGQIAFASGLGSDAPPLLIKAAKRLEALDLDLARETYLSAWIAAMFAGRLAGAGDLAGTGVMAEVVAFRGPVGPGSHIRCRPVTVWLSNDVLGLPGMPIREYGDGLAPGVPGTRNPFDASRETRAGRAGMAATSSGPAGCPETPGSPLAGEEHQPGVARRAELPVDGQAEQVTVEAAAVQIVGAQQNPAAQDVYSTIPASR